MQLFYTPQHARVGDVIPYYEDGKFHLFYLKNFDYPEKPLKYKHIRRISD